MVAPATALEPLLIGYREAARLLGVSDRTIFSLAKQGQIPAVRIGRAVRFDPADLRTWIEKAKTSDLIT
jgi:excisionase family DNA binding protein